MRNTVVRRISTATLIMLCVGAASLSTYAQEQSDLLTFINKDSLHGQLLSGAPAEYGVRWKHDNVKAPIDFALAGISHIKLGKRPALQRTAFGATIHLTNDDILTGNIVSLNNEALVLDTWYAGKINVKRLMIKEINPNAGGGGGLLYEGPTSMTGWETQEYNDGGGNRPAWTFKGNALYASHSYPIGRAINNMPEIVSIRFRASWRGYPAFYFAFLTDNLKQYHGSDCYMLQVSSSSLNLQRYTRNSGSRNLGSHNHQRFRSNPPRSAVFTMLVDKKKKTLTLLIDDEMVKQWTDGDIFAGTGNGILFQPQSAGNLKITDIQVSEWDGEIPDKTGGSPELPQDLLRFANNDKVSGTLSAIADGNVQFATTYATMSVPLKKVVQIRTATEKAERARRNRNDIRAVFGEKGSVTLQLDTLVDGKLSGSSDNFGAVKLPLEAFRKLEFNIYEEKQEADDGFDF